MADGLSQVASPEQAQPTAHSLPLLSVLKHMESQNKACLWYVHIHPEAWTFIVKMRRLV